jgi:hypothetical protein
LKQKVKAFFVHASREKETINIFAWKRSIKNLEIGLIRKILEKNTKISSGREDQYSSTSTSLR